MQLLVDVVRLHAVVVVARERRVENRLARGGRQHQDVAGRRTAHDGEVVAVGSDVELAERRRAVHQRREGVGEVREPQQRRLRHELGGERLDATSELLLLLGRCGRGRNVEGRHGVGVRPRYEQHVVANLQAVHVRREVDGRVAGQRQHVVDVGRAVLAREREPPHVDASASDGHIAIGEHQGVGGIVGTVRQRPGRDRWVRDHWVPVSSSRMSVLVVSSSQARATTASRYVQPAACTM